jgi:hypothetical protein
VRLLVNGQVVADTTWDGKREERVSVEIPSAVLQSGANTLFVENVGDTAAAYSMVFLNRFEVRYARRVTADAGRWAGVVDVSGTAEVTGLGGAPLAVDLTNGPQWLRGVVPGPSGPSLRVEAGHRYLATTEGFALTPAVRRAESTTLMSSRQRADWILVAPRTFLGAAAPLVALRRGQGLLTKTVALEDVADTFGHGEAGPQGLEAFLAFAYGSWQKPSPRYVVLLGDATYDPKDYLKTGVLDRVPFRPIRTSYLWTASDPAFAAVNGEDLLPDLALGRLPAATAEQARALVEKLVAYESAGRRLDGRAVLVADNADAGGPFEADADELAATVLAGRDVQKIYLRDQGASTRAEIVAAFDSGPGLLSYIGHGATAVWASENIFNNSDVAALQPQAQQPFLLTLNCLNGFFHFPPFDSLAEALVKAEGKGAIAAFAPSGLSLDEAAHAYHQALLREIESGRHARLGDALLAAQSAYADSGRFPELLAIYHLLGDPAQHVR